MLAGEAYGFADPFSGSEGWQRRYGTQECRSSIRGHDRGEVECSREDMGFALESHRRAIRAIDEGRFDPDHLYGDVHTDEGPRRDTSLEKMAALKTLREGGRITAAVSSQISDAAAAMLIVSGARAEGARQAARPFPSPERPRRDPVDADGAIPATAYARKSGIAKKDIDVAEINEAFARSSACRRTEAASRARQPERGRVTRSAPPARAS